jgi:hypothetical protein
MGTGWHTRGVPGCGPGGGNVGIVHKISGGRRKSTSPLQKISGGRAGGSHAPRGAHPGSDWAGGRGGAPPLGYERPDGADDPAGTGMSRTRARPRSATPTCQNLRVGRGPDSDTPSWRLGPDSLEAPPEPAERDRVEPARDGAAEGSGFAGRGNAEPFELPPSHREADQRWTYSPSRSQRTTVSCSARVGRYIVGIDVAPGPHGPPGLAPRRAAFVVGLPPERRGGPPVLVRHLG